MDFSYYLYLSTKPAPLQMAPHIGSNSITPRGKEPLTALLDVLERKQAAKYDCWIKITGYLGALIAKIWDTNSCLISIKKKKLTYLAVLCLCTTDYCISAGNSGLCIVSLVSLPFGSKKNMQPDREIKVEQYLNYSETDRDRTSMNFTAARRKMMRDP